MGNSCGWSSCLRLLASTTSACYHFHPPCFCSSPNEPPHSFIPPTSPSPYIDATYSGLGASVLDSTKEIRIYNSAAAATLTDRLCVVVAVVGWEGRQAQEELRAAADGQTTTNRTLLPTSNVKQYNERRRRRME